MRSMRRLSAVLGLLVLATACADLPTSPTPAAARPDVLSGKSGYTVIQATKAQRAATVSAVVGNRGGTLSLNGHSLMVPVGALAQPTRFTMTTAPGTAIEVELTAQDVRTGVPVLVFPTPLRLTLSYAGAKVSDPGALLLGWVLDGQVMSVQASDVDRAHKTVSAWVYHFTQWAICN